MTSGFASTILSKNSVLSPFSSMILYPAHVLTVLPNTTAFLMYSFSPTFSLGELNGVGTKNSHDFPQLNKHVSHVTCTSEASVKDVKEQNGRMH